MNNPKSFNQRDNSMSRSLAEHVIATYVENVSSIKNPVKYLDLTIDQKEGLKWSSKHGPSAVSNARLNSFDGEKEKSLVNNDSNYATIEKCEFNFIYVECTTEGSSYFDCVFRKIARNGLFVISTFDDPALYGRPAEPALRCYSGLIMRTYYAPEMAVRLILAAMVRSAARFAKSIEVILAIVVKSSVTIIVQVRKGADSAVKCLKSVQTLLHCTVCEERAFLPQNHGFVIDGVSQHLSCDCARLHEGQTVMSLGPLWAGPLGSPSFLASLLLHVKDSLAIKTFLQDLITELRCERSTKMETCLKGVLGVQNERTDKTGIESNTLKRKHEDDSPAAEARVKLSQNADVDSAPPFYYSLHKHKPVNSEKLVKVDRVIETLHRLNFRASRTHFNSKAIKTNCTLKQLQTVISQITK